VAVAIVAILAALPAPAAPGSRVVSDSITGLAISGFDPVAYFTDRKPELGEGGHELVYRRTVWRFRNEGNRAAFARDPEVYAPRFGGHDPVALARGVAVAGHPLIWLIAGNRLYLFSKPEHRRLFVDDIEHALGVAVHRWPEVERTLVP
jgi:hypothetical protein